MAEVISATASVIAIVQIAEHIIGTCNKYINGVKEAPHDLQTIVVELTALKTIFETLTSLASWNGGVSNIMNELVDRNGPIEGCLHSIRALEQLLPSQLVQIGDITSPTSKKRKAKFTLATLAWPLKASKAAKLLEEITRYKDTINLALTTKSMQNVEYIKTKTSEISEKLTDSQRQDVYRWLHHTDPSSIHYRSQENYEPGTCDWIARIPCWTEWLQTKIRCLWIHGIPGAGKTVLMSYLIQKINTLCKESQRKAAYAYYYCYFGRNQDEAEPFLRWLLCQLCRKEDLVPSAVYEMYKYGGQPSLANLLVSLESILQEYEVVYVALDAIDESKPATKLLEIIRELAIGCRFEKVQLLTSSRDYAEIVNVMSAVSSSIPMANAHVKNDIKILVRSLLRSNPKFKHWPHELLKQVEEVLPERAHGMFRWAVVQVDDIQRLKPERNIVERALANLPKTLYETYDGIFARIPEEDRVVVLHTLHWISFHGKLHHDDGIPLEILLQALDKSLSQADKRQERFLDKDTLLELCGCLISISINIVNIPRVRSSDPFSGKPVEHQEEITASVLSFAHYTVLEYLELSSNSGGPMPVGIRYANGKSLQLDFLQLVLTKFQDINQESFLDDTSGFRDVIATIYGNFDGYCVMMTPLLLFEFPFIEEESEILYSLALDAVDPTKPNYKRLTQAVRRIAHEVPAYHSYPGLIPFWLVEWRRFYEDTLAPQFFNLLCMPLYDEGAPAHAFTLVTKLLERTDAKSILQTRLNVALPVARGFWAYTDTELRNFEGSAIEIFAQMANTEFERFNLLLQYGSGAFDPSRILLLYIGCHNHQHCEAYEIGDECVIDRLLAMGAKVDNMEYHITPLQMAVDCWDVVGVKSLLKAGADPNETGNQNVTRWDRGARMSRFNRLIGLSPLQICSILHRADEYDRIKDLPEIKGALVQYGAVRCSEESSDEEDPA